MFEIEDMNKKLLTFILFCSLLLTSMSFSYSQTKNDEAYLGTIANVVGHDLYISYVYLGSLTDSYIYRVYAQKFALNLLHEYVDYISIMKKQMESLTENKLIPAADTPYVNMQIKAYETMRLQALEFIKYVETGESQYVETFENLRREAWSLIATILGIPEEIEKVYKN